MSANDFFDSLMNQAREKDRTVPRSTVNSQASYNAVSGANDFFSSLKQQAKTMDATSFSGRPLKTLSSISNVSKSDFSTAKTPLLSGYDERADDYDGLFGTLRGVGESALAGIRSANEALAGWLADVTPDVVKENISLVDADQDAARAAASAASGAVQERFGRTEESQEQGRERQQQATDYLTQRQNELDTGEDVERLFEEAANSQEEAARIREYAVGDSGAFAQLLFDAGVGGVQMGYDALMNFLIPGSGLASAGLRGAGSGILEAQQSGASTLQQLAYGLGVGAVEAATEKISNLAGPLRRVFGGGVADRAVTSLVNRLTSSTAGRAVLNLAANAAGEGFEEFVSSAANPALRRIFDENALAEYGDPQMWADAAYDALVGATIGGVLGGAGQVIENRASRRASQNATEAPTTGAAPQTGVDTSTGVNPVEAGIDASVRLFNEGGGVIDTQTPNNTASVVEQLRAAIPQLQNNTPVAEVQGNELPQGNRLIDRLVAFAESIGNRVTRAGFGDVLFSRSRIKNSVLGHGVSPAKIETFAAVPAVIQNGTQIGYAPNWKGRGYDTYIFAAPVSYRGAPTYLAAVVTRDTNDGRYYLHEVINEDGSLISANENQQETTSDGRASQTGTVDTVSSPAGNSSISPTGANINAREVSERATSEATADNSTAARTPIASEPARSDNGNSQNTGYNAENSPVYNAQSVPPQSSYSSAPETIKTVVPSQSEARGGSGAPTESASVQPRGGASQQRGLEAGTLSNDSIPDSGQNVNGLADSMTDEQLLEAQQRNDADITSINDVLNAAQGGQQFPQGIIDQLTGQLPGLMQEQQRLASVEQAKRVQRGEVSRNFGQPENHIDNRNPDSVKGNRVAAFSFDHPQLHGYFVQAARDLQGMADYAAEAERGRSNRGNRIDRERNRSAVEHAYSRELRNAMESGDLSKPQVLDACQRIIDNHGQENVLAAKRVELIIDDMLTNGYTTADGVDVSPNMEYIAAKEQIAGARGEERAIERYDDDLAIGAFGMPYTDAELAEQEVERQRIRDQYAAMRGQGVNSPEIPNSSAAVNTEDSLGAAPAGFDRLSAALERYGEMPERGTGAREVSIPRAMNDDSVIPRTVQTFANAEATPETTYTDITRILEQGGFNRAVITDRASLGRAEQTITDKGFQQALIDWTATVRSGRVSKDTTTLGLALYNNAINSGDTQTGIQILTDIVDNARTAAQATQAMSILNKLTPEGRLYGVQRSIANLQDELNTKYGDLAPDLHIDDSLAGDYLNATDEQTRFEILDQIYQDIANQIPQDWYDKLNAWRYFAMLANPRTHVRNLLGNSAMAGLTSIRNRISSGLQRRFVSDRSQRTRETISRRNSAEDAARYQVGLQEYKRINDMLGDAGKYTNELNRIRRHMRAPFNGLLGRAVDFASNTLEAEDIFFSQKAYASNLAQFLRARGITAEDYVSGNAGQEVIAEAQAYAIREAQRLTFRDFNAFSNFVQRLANLGGDSGVGRAWQTIVGANMPFTRTPANIVVRGVEYSPIGLMRGLFNLGVNVKRGNMTAGEAIDQISSGLVGTALVGLGALLASQGIITGGGSDDEEQAAFDELRGFQPYALQIGGNSYTLDWLAPAALPFFTGAEIWNQLAGRGSEDEETNALEAVLQGIGHMTDPMLEMSMLSGISDLLDSVAYYQGSNSIWPVLSSSVTNYISQFFPSVFGAIERTIEDRRQSSYTDPTSIIPDDLQYPIAQAMNRLPGEYNQVDYIDAWGRTESTGSLAGRAASNFISPGYYSRLSESEVEDELQRVYDATGGEYNVFPDRATMGNTTINGERLTPEQYTEYATMLGQTRLAEVSALMETDAYKAMSDAEKARAIQEVYDYALQTAKHAIDPSYEVDSRYEKAAEYGDIAEYLAFDRAWSSVEDSKGANTAAFEAVMQDYERMSTQKQNALMEALGEGTRFDDVVDAYEAGIEPERWYDAYDKHQELNENENLSANSAATEFAKWLDTESGFNANQRNVIEEQMRFWNMFPADTERYDALIDAGFTPEKADAVYDAVSALQPQAGKTQVSDLQRYEAIANTSGLTDAEKVQALTEYEGASSGDRQKFSTAYAYGISPELYVNMLEMQDEGVGDEDGNGRYKQDEAKLLIDALMDSNSDMTTREAAVLWAMLCPTSKTGNPYGNIYGPTSMEWDYAP